MSESHTGGQPLEPETKRKPREEREYQILIQTQEGIAEDSPVEKIAPGISRPTQYKPATDETFPDRSAVKKWIKANGQPGRKYLPADAKTISVSSRTKEIRSLT